MHDLARTGTDPRPRTSAADAISGQAGVDVIFGQDGADAISGGGDDDYVEGQGGADGIHGDVALSAAEVVGAPAGSAWATPAVDGAAGDPGQDDLAGGWARQGYRDGNDTIHGDGSDDFVVADNGSVARVVNDGKTESVYAKRYGTLRPIRPRSGSRRSGRGIHPLLPGHEHDRDLDLRGHRRLRLRHRVRRRRPGRALRPGRRRHRSVVATATTTSTVSSVTTSCSGRAARTPSSATAAASRTGTRPAPARRRRR